MSRRIQYNRRDLKEAIERLGADCTYEEVMAQWGDRPKFYAETFKRYKRLLFNGNGKGVVCNGGSADETRVAGPGLDVTPAEGDIPATAPQSVNGTPSADSHKRLSAFVRLGVIVEELGVAEVRRQLDLYEELVR